MTVGPADLSTTYRYYDSAWGEWTTEFRDYTDYTKSGFYVRGKSKVSLAAKRKSKIVTLSAKASYYNPEDEGYKAYNAKKATFQAKSGKKWKTIKMVNFAKGKASIKVNQGKTSQYRVTFPQVSWATGATSKIVKK